MEKTRRGLLAMHCPSIREQKVREKQDLQN